MFQMKKLSIIFTMFALSYAVHQEPLFDKNEDIDHIVGGKKAKLGSFQFLVSFMFSVVSES